VLVLGADGALPALAQIPVIPLSTQARGLSWEVALSPDDGVQSPCVLKPEWIRSVPRGELGPLITTFPDRRWPEVRAAVLDVLGLA
jgi:mRNA-degrading endonuclease toxin of MazEF toxin-antitoxin module